MMSGTIIKSAIVALSFAATRVASQSPSNVSICDYYTTVALKENNATNQEALIILVVNTAVIGNFTPNAQNLKVPGILAQNQTYNGSAVNLLPYFDGSLASSNRGSSAGVSVNFLDDGGAAPLKQSKPSNGESSNQYKLMTHLYEYFGILLGCSKYGKPGYPAFNGAISMYNVHKFMALDAYEFGFFVQQVAYSAASFGVAEADLTYVGNALGDLFGHRCSAQTQVVPEAQDALQAICITGDCPEAKNATCSLYGKVQEPMHANGSVTVTGTHHISTASTATATTTEKSGAEVTRKLCGSLMVLFALATVYWLV